MSLKYEGVAIQASHSQPTCDTQKLTGFYLKMFNSPNQVLFKNNFSENVQIAEHFNSVLVDIRVLSQKTMKEIWDNDEDEFWNSQ